MQLREVPQTNLPYDNLPGVNLFRKLCWKKELKKFDSLTAKGEK